MKCSLYFYDVFVIETGYSTRNTCRAGIDLISQDYEEKRPSPE